MHQNLLSVATLLLIAGCKGSDAMNLTPYGSLNAGSFKVDAKDGAVTLNQPSAAASAVNSLAGVLANGGNFIIDASSLGGGILIGKNGQLFHPPQTAALGAASVNGVKDVIGEKISSPTFLQNLQNVLAQNQPKPPPAPVAKLVGKTLPESAFKFPAGNPFVPKFQSDAISHPISISTLRAINPPVPKRTLLQILKPEAIKCTNPTFKSGPGLKFLIAYANDDEFDFI